MSTIETEEEERLVKHCIADIKSKMKVYKKQLRAYIAYLKVIEKIKKKVKQHD